MNAITKTNKQCAIVYDGDYIQQPAERLFDPAWWERSGAIAGYAPGRGSAVFVDAPFGQAVLRNYLRGGWAARFSHERYVFTGIEYSRPVREFRLLQKLQEHELPAPVPLAALCRRGLLTYTGALLTRRLMDVTPLSDLLGQLHASDEHWSLVARCIHRFHKSGLRHADLNARNILLAPGAGKVYLVDFDRSVFTPGRAVDGRANLARLRRSLKKSWPVETSGRMDSCWQTLLRAYHA